ncbi:hypothetical protein QL285_094617 [Trifolium repens]|nr:hypothetical protein QL285_094617 [Trifolium repens]
MVVTPYLSGLNTIIECADLLPRRHSFCHHPPPSVSLFHHLLVSLELPLIFKKNFTSGFGDSKRVDQELQQLIYLTTFRFVTVFCFAYNQV